MSEKLASSGPIVAVIGETNIIAIYCYDKDGNPIAIPNVYKCILTVRATEDAQTYLFRTFGTVENTGGNEDPGVIAFALYPEDTKDIAPGDYYYDTVILAKGQWFDFDTDRYKNNLIFTYQEGKIRVSGIWKNIQEGYIALTDNAVNYIEIDPATGEISANIVGWTEGKKKLYRVRTDAGKIITEWPGSDWFSQGTHSGLDFYYNAGKVLTADMELVEVSAGHITLTDNETNYIEVSDDGIVSSNIYNFTQGKHPLYIATAKAGTITSVQKIDDIDAIEDDRNIFIRGDEVTWTSKDIFQLQAGITKPAEMEA